jgi:hypothetical protein
MIKFNHRHFVQGLLAATALALVLRAEGAAPAFAAVVNVTGANGAPGSYGKPGGAGHAADADAGHLIPNSDLSNSATATGGNGGAGGIGAFTTGGAGGWATSTATTKGTTATATATGGAGGNGGVNHLIFFGAPSGGNGGQAIATSSAADAGSGTVTSAATANGGAGGAGGTQITQFQHNTGLAGSGGKATATASGQSTGGGAVNVTASATGGNVAAGGLATATATGQSTGSGAVIATASATGGSGGAAGAANAYATGVAVNGNVQASASANGGGGVIAGTAFAQSEAKNASGEALTTASAPGGRGSTSPSAVTAAGVGPGSVTLARTFTQGQVVSDAILTPKGQYIGVGAMSAAYGRLGPLQYDATAVFDFTTPKSGESVYLNLQSDNFGPIGFDTLKLEVLVDGLQKCSLSACTFTSVAAARAFFASRPIDLGSLAGSQAVQLDYFLDYKSGTSAVVGDGFGFTYDLATKPVAATPTTAAFDFPISQSSTVPEPSTWAMMLVGFAGLGFVGYRRARATGGHF